MEDGDKKLKAICHNENGEKVATIHYTVDKEGHLAHVKVKDVKKRKRSKIDKKRKRGRKL